MSLVLAILLVGAQGTRRSLEHCLIADIPRRPCLLGIVSPYHVGLSARYDEEDVTHLRQAALVWTRVASFEVSKFSEQKEHAH